MPGPQAFWSTLKQKLQPSIDIQQRGSVSRAIRNSSTFGPQINTGTFDRFQHKQNPIIGNQLNSMNK